MLCFPFLSLFNFLNITKESSCLKIPVQRQGRNKKHQEKETLRLYTGFILFRSETRLQGELVTLCHRMLRQHFSHLLWLLDAQYALHLALYLGDSSQSLYTTPAERLRNIKACHLYNLSWLGQNHVPSRNQSICSVLDWTQPSLFTGILGFISPHSQVFFKFKSDSSMYL